MTVGPRRSEALTDSLGEYGSGSQTEVWRPPGGLLEGFPGSPLLKFNFDLQEFPQLQTEKSL